METPSTYKVTIRPNRKWLHFPLKELGEYKDLLFLLVRRDFVSKYKQTVLGPIWFALQPLMQTLILSLILGRFANTPTNGLPHFLFFLCGQITWNYCAQTFGAVSSCFLSNAGIFTKVYFPRLVVPFSQAIVNVLSFLILFVLFLLFWVYFKFWTPAGASLHIQFHLLPFLPLLIAQAAIIALGAGLWFASLTAKYRDLTMATPIIVQIWMYLSIIIPFSNIPVFWQKWLALNPMVIVTECIRYILLGKGVINLQMISLSVITALFFFLTGLLVFQRTERTFADTV